MLRRLNRLPREVFKRLDPALGEEVTGDHSAGLDRVVLKITSSFGSMKCRRVRAGAEGLRVPRGPAEARACAMGGRRRA